MKGSLHYRGASGRTRSVVRRQGRYQRAAAVTLLAAALCMLTGGFLPQPLHAQGDGPARPRILDCRVGFDHAYTAGAWTPVWIDVIGGEENETGRLEVIVQDNDGEPTSVTTLPDRPVSLEPGRVTTVPVAVRIGRLNASIAVRLYVDGRRRPVHSRQFTAAMEPGEGRILGGLSPADRLIVVVGESSVGLGEALTDSSTPSQLPVENRVALVEDAAELPTRWYEYDGVDVLVLSASDAGMWRALSPDGVRMQAIGQWVEQGGRLVVLCGSQAPELLAPGGALSGLAPGRFGEMITLNRSTALEEYGDFTEAVSPAGRTIEMSVPRLVNVSGVIEAFDGQRPTDLPLVIRAPWGFGWVVFAAFDLDRPPLRTWAGRPDLLRKLLDYDAEADAQRIVSQNPYQLATRDDAEAIEAIRGQIAEHFLGVETVPFYWVALLVIGYILLIGPLDYLLVKRWLKRMEATWITFPIWVILVSVAAYWYAYAKKGDQLRLNQVEVVDVDLTSGLARGVLWTSIFSPQPDRYTLELAPKLPSGAAAQANERRLSWMGGPHSGIGIPSGGGQMLRAAYAYSPTLDQLNGVPIQIWSTKSFEATWNGTVPQLLTTDLVATDEGLVEGEIVNRSGAALGDVRLVYRDWAYRLGNLEDGASIQIQRDLDPIRRSTLLSPSTGLAGYGDPAEWSSQTGLAGILDAALFYDSIRQVSFRNGQLARYDMSPLLELDRAILMATVDGPRSELVRDGVSMHSGNEQTWVLYRFLAPVAPLGE